MGSSYIVAHSAVFLTSGVAFKVAHETLDRDSPSLILCHDGSGCIKELETEHIYLEFNDLADLIHQVRMRI